MKTLHSLDFDSARLSWVTRDGFYGDWKIIAAATHAGLVADQREDLFLASGVMAGHVFGKDRLPILPPYSYQLFSSLRRSFILRDPLDATERADTCEENSDAFTSFDICAPLRISRSLDLQALNTATIHGAWPLSMSISRFSTPWSVQFPINHINSLGPNREGGHVETGPVLLPTDWLADAPVTNSGGFVLAYIFFNCPGQIDVLMLEQKPHTGGPRTFRHYQRLHDIEVQLFGKL